MMKFFRKYTKHLLAIFMALLLVVWLGGQALQNLFNKEHDYSKDVVGRAFGEEVKEGELTRIKSQTDIGQNLVRGWNMPWYGVLGQLGVDPQLLQSIRYQLRRQPLSLEEWFLLDAEARRNDIHVSADEVEQVKSMLSPEYLTAIRDQHKLSIDQIDQAIRAYLRLEEAALQAADAVTVSEADIQDYIRQTDEKVKAEMVVVDPMKLVDSKYQPTDAELKAQFDKYKDKPAGYGPGDYGYQLPDATQVEYIEVNADAIAANQQVTEDEAWNYWSAHKDEFKRPASQPATTSAPASRPEPPKPYETFYEAKPLVIRKIQHDRAVKVANRIGEELVKALSASWLSQPTTKPGDYKQPPASALASDLYEKTIAAHKDKNGALSYGRTSLASAQDISSNPRIGQTSAFAGAPSQVSFSQVAFMVAGLKADKDEEQSHTRLFRNVYETCAELVSDSNGNVFVFRNIAVRPAQAPASFEQVRTKLVADVQYVRACAEAERQAKALADQARKAGLKAAFDGSELSKKLDKSAFVPTESFPRKHSFGMGGMTQLYAGYVPGVGRDPELVDLCFDMANRVTATQPSPVAVHEQKRGGKWIVVEYKGLVPVTRDEYNKQREDARKQLLGQKRLQFVLDWFNQDDIFARTGWHDNNLKAQPKNNAPKRAAAF